jgi:hemoglobin-like flavoprotein
MDADTLKAVKLHYQGLSPKLGELGDAFYSELFETAPSVRRLFPEDMSRQKSHLTAAIAIVARNISSLDALEQPLSEMGARHAGYGAAPEHYPVVRDCLLRAMARVSGDSWTPQLHDAWYAALNAVAAAMLRGAARAEIEVVRGRARSPR